MSDNFNVVVFLEMVTYINNIDSMEEKKEVRSAQQKKLQQKYYFGKRRRVQNKEVSIGDQVLIRQKKSTIKPPFDPKP